MAASKKGTPTGIYDSNMKELRVGDSVKDLDSGMSGYVNKYRNLVNTAGVKMNPSRCILTESWIDYEFKHKNQKDPRPDMEDGVSESFKKNAASNTESEKVEAPAAEDIPEEGTALLVAILDDYSSQALVDELRRRGVEVKARVGETVIVWKEL